MINPSLRWQPREQRSPILKPSTAESTLSWLERTGRFMEIPTEIDPRLLEDDELTEALTNSYDIEEAEEEEDQEF
jgi:hypothetical protein